MAVTWKLDDCGTHLESAADALRSLRERAEGLIREAELRGIDARSRRIRLRDDDGTIHFEGTLAEAAKLKLMALLVPVLFAANFLLSASGDATSLFEAVS